MKKPIGSPSPLWMALSRETFAPALLDGSCRTDVVVIGGGISGLSAALHLARTGAKVIVLESGEIGSGASGRNNGQVIPTLTRHDPAMLVAAWGVERGERFLHMLQGSANLLFDTAASYGIDCDAARSGWIQPSRTPGRARAAERRAAQWQARGVRARGLSAAEVAARLGTTAYFGGWLYEGAGHINPLAFTRGLARAAAQEGAVVHAHTPATSLTRRGGEWWVGTGRGDVRCNKVVVATAAYTAGLWPKLAHSIVPVVSYQVATEPLGEAGREILPGNEACSDTRMDLRYFRKDREGRLISGAALAVQLMGKRRVAGLVLKRLAETFPSLRGKRADFVWSGHIGMSPERLPRFHRSDDGLVAWIGCNGRGLALSMAMGGVVADAVRGIRDEELPLSPEAVCPLPLAPVLAKVARLALPYYRYRDSRDVA